VLTLFVMLWIVDLSKFLKIISSANLGFLAMALCAYFSTTLLMTFRIKFILTHLGEKISYGNSFKANFGGLCASDFTPGRVGYFITPLILQKNALMPLEKGMATIVTPQIFDFFLKGVGAAAAIALIVYASPILSSNITFLWAGAGMVVAFAIFMYAALFVPRSLLLMRKFSFLPFVSEFASFLQSIQQYQKNMSSIFPAIFLISLAIFVIKGFEWYFFGRSLGISLETQVAPIFIFMVLQPLVTAFQFTPFPTVAGLGISEGGAVASMALLGVPTELAVAYSLLVRGGTMVVNSIGVFELVRFVTGAHRSKR